MMRKGEEEKGSVSIRAAVLTVSDTRTAGDDLSGDRLCELLRADGIEITHRAIVTDDLEPLKQILFEFTERADVNLILTTGGTGFAPRDNTPEATRAVIEREAPGLTEAMRSETSTNTPMSMLSRAVAGIRGGTLIINLPGSPKAVEECYAVIRPVLPHAIGLIAGETRH